MLAIGNIPAVRDFLPTIAHHLIEPCPTRMYVGSPIRFSCRFSVCAVPVGKCCRVVLPDVAGRCCQTSRVRPVVRSVISASGSAILRSVDGLPRPLRQAQTGLPSVGGQKKYSFRGRPVCGATVRVTYRIIWRLCRLPRLLLGPFLSCDGDALLGTNIL